MNKIIIAMCVMAVCSGAMAEEKDRYDVRKLQNDPEVLVSAAKHPSYSVEYVSKVKEQIVKDNLTNINDDVVVYASIEDSVTGEETLPVKCESENNLITCEVF